MLYHFLVPLSQRYGGFNVFRYTSFRTAWALITALVFCYALFPRFIRWMQGHRVAQVIREDGPRGHIETKGGTPTMGGLPMVAGIVFSGLLWCRLDQPVVWIALSVLVGYGAIGLADDWLKVRDRSSRGLPGRWKLLWQVAIGLAVVGWGVHAGAVRAAIPLPFLKGTALDFASPWPGGPDLSWLYVVVGAFILTATSNAVNLTDGLDGLAIGPVMTSAGTFGILAYLAGHAGFARYLFLSYVPGAGELMVLCLCMVGAGLGFLWYNAYPAQVFMGDVGSLALGGALGAVAVLVKQELLLVLVGGVFVLETVSVIVQVASFKLTGRRVFAMAPVHHHFEQHGWSEPKIIVRFWIISILLSLVALSTLKLR